MAGMTSAPATGMTQPPALDLFGDPATLTAALIDIESVSGDEGRLADAVQRSLAALGRYELARIGNTVLARTHLGAPTRVVLAGHLDTVPIAGNVPARWEGDLIHGCGATDMKSGDAMMLHLAATLDAPARDLTFIFYECEEVEFDRNGLTAVQRELPEWLVGDLAVLGEPTDGRVEAGCQGTLAFRITTRGARAHAARSWLGANAIHAAAPVLQRLAAYQPRTVDVDGCSYREGLNAVGIEAGIANNVIPDTCVTRVNFRFAPVRSLAEAEAHVREVFDGFDLEITDGAEAAPPGLRAPAAAEFVRAAGGRAVAKYGWTDVARFAALGIPAVNYGPGDPGLAHTPGEFVSATQIREMTAMLRRFLAEDSGPARDTAPEG
jgi:succinyl-diaminopimelate desuccinylase